MKQLALAFAVIFSFSLLSSEKPTIKLPGKACFASRKGDMTYLKYVFESTPFKLLGLDFESIEIENRDPLFSMRVKGESFGTHVDVLINVEDDCGTLKLGDYEVFEGQRPVDFFVKRNLEKEN